MSAIGNTTPTTATTGTAIQSGSTSATNPNATLDKDGFLKMFVAQMQNQDPSSSQDPNQSTQEMATFSMVEQITNLVTQEQGVAQQLGTINAVGLIGRTVSYTDTGGNLQSGVVKSVSTTSAGASTLTVGDQTGVDPTTITQVA
jgi:flagellar basal-body rod modification protein FlgD